MAHGLESFQIGDHMKILKKTGGFWELWDPSSIHYLVHIFYLAFSDFCCL